MKKLDINALAALLIIACVACFITVLHYTSFERHHTHDRPDKQSNHTHAAANHDEVAEGPFIAQVYRPKTVEAYDKNTYYRAHTSQESLQNDDHKAQILMAIVSVLGAIIGLIGLVMIGGTLVYTRKASSVANNTLKVAKDASVAELRPWIFLNRQFECDFSLHPNGVSLRWNYSLENIGKSPARQVRLSQKIIKYDNSYDFEGVYISYVQRCREEALTTRGVTVIPAEKRDPSEWNRWAGTYTTPQGTGASHALFICITYIYADGRIGLDSQAFGIEQLPFIGPRSHVLRSFSRLRKAE